LYRESVFGETMEEKELLDIMEKGKLYTKSMLRERTQKHYYIINVMLDSLIQRGIITEQRLGDKRKVYSVKD
jgi:hypothetical protein